MTDRIPTHTASSLARAVRHAAVYGFTVQHAQGESGDGGWGSRRYYAKPDADKNEFGWPLETMWLSLVGADWVCDHHVITEGAIHPGLRRAFDATQTVESVSASLAELLTVCEQELDERKNSGNDEEFGELEAKCDRARVALGLPARGKA